MRAECETVFHLHGEETEKNIINYLKKNVNFISYHSRGISGGIELREVTILSREPFLINDLVNSFLQKRKSKKETIDSLPSYYN